MDERKLGVGRHANPPPHGRLGMQERYIEFINEHGNLGIIGLNWFRTRETG
jgi:hypothetical protein